MSAYIVPKQKMDSLDQIKEAQHILHNTHVAMELFRQNADKFTEQEVRFRLETVLDVILITMSDLRSMENDWSADRKDGKDSGDLQARLEKVMEKLVQISSRTPKYGGDLCKIDWEYVAHKQEELADYCLKILEDK